MSILDYDPKYAKLREWRKQHGFAVASLPDLPQPALTLRLSCRDLASLALGGMVVSPAMFDRLMRIGEDGSSE